jgi:GAF domain-containing protein
VRHALLPAHPSLGGFTLFIGDEIVGCLSVQNPTKHAYSEEQIKLFRALASYSAIAIANALGYRKLEQTLKALKLTQQQLVLQEKWFRWVP